MEDDADTETVLYSPTWAVAAVCAVFILCSLAVERAIFYIGHVFRSHNQTALLASLEKIKEELMVVGFISLALTVGQRSVAKICVSRELIDFMPQCKKPLAHTEQEPNSLLKVTTLRDQAVCAEGKAPFISLEGLHQLHILLFVLAIVHIFYSIAIMALGMWKVHQWKAWEERAENAESLHPHGQIRLTKDVTFIRRHASGMWSKTWLSALFAAFFQQFFQSVSETDYLTLRHGFIKKHKLTSFNFYKYILRTLEDDFKHVVGISPSLWMYMILVTFLNVQGWELYLWISFVPLIIVLAVGTKLRHVITQMAVQCSQKHAVVEGLADVKPTDAFFWFGSPRMVLYLIHYVLFQDALELSLHVWTTCEFPNGNCFHKQRYIILGRLLLGVLAQLICGYVMLPIYALVSQMGSEMKGDYNYGDEDGQKASGRVHEEVANTESEIMSKEIGETTVGLEAMQSSCLDDKLKNLESSDFEKQKNGTCDMADIEEDNDDHRLPCLQKKMSYIQRVSRGVQGGDYHTLDLLGSNQKPY